MPAMYKKTGIYDNYFLLFCKAPRPPDCNKSLDSFIIQSWNNTKNECDAYIQWIDYSLLKNVHYYAMAVHI